MVSKRLTLALPTFAVMCLVFGSAVEVCSSQVRERGAEQILPPDIFEELFEDFNAELGPALSEVPPPVRSVDRDRRPSRFEKMHRTELRKFAPIVIEAKPSIVRLESDGELVAFGTVVRKDGYLLTKASELEGHADVMCQLSNGENYQPDIVGVSSDHDLALLRISPRDLTPAKWAATSPTIGSLVVTGDETGRPLASGVTSVERRVLIDTNQAVLGVVPQPARAGIVVESVAEGSAAELAGLEVGDRIVKIDDTKIESVNELTNHIRLHEPGDAINIHIERSGRTRVLEAKLGGRTLLNPFQQSVAETSRFGSEPSRRSSDFPQVIQHDTPLWPEQCGTPLLNLDGEVVGINIARGNRIESYAIPADVVQTVVSELLEDKE